MRTAIVSLLALLAPSSLHASDVLTPCDALGGADAVFLGTVQGRVRRWVDPGDPAHPPYETDFTLFSIERAWRGVSSNPVLLQADPALVRGQRYLLYGRRYSHKPEAYSISPAYGVKNADEAGDHLSFLERVAPGSTIYGILEQREYATDQHALVRATMEGVPIRVWNETFSTYVVTGAGGSFVATGLPAGTYSVDPGLPEDLHVIHSGARQVQVRDGGCAASHMRAVVNGRVRGRVLGPDGRPLSPVSVDLVPLDVSGHVEGMGSVSADADGEFEFPARAPGRYLLGVNLRRGPQAQGLEYPRTYYPGTEDESKAIPVEVGRGTASEGYEFSVGPRIPRTWLDIEFASIETARGKLLLCVENLQDLVQRGLTLEPQRGVPYRLPLLEGLRYRLHAHLKFPGGHLESEPVEVVGVAGGSTLRLTLDAPRQYWF